MTKRDCVVVHEGVQHSGDLAAALNDAGRLASLVTRVQIGDNAPWPWSLPRVQSALDRRIVSGLPDSRVTRLQPALGLADRVVARIAGARGQRLTAWASDRFNQAVPARLGPTTRCVIGTDRASGPLFEALRRTRPDVALVLDVSHPPDVIAQRLLREDAAAWGLDETAYDDFRSGPCQDQSLEMSLADRIVVASEFSASTLVEIGVQRSRIRVVPYSVGVPPISDDRVKGSSRELRVLSLGALSERKGVSLLLASMRELHAGSVDVELQIVGRQSAGYQLPEMLPGNTTYTGPAGRHEVPGIWNATDLLILPSMCEGYGRTILEALAHGCAVVATDTSGAPDILAQCPHAPITIVPVSERDRIASLLAAISSDRVRYLRPADARDAARMFSRDRYLSMMSSVADEAIAVRCSVNASTH